MTHADRLMACGASLHDAALSVAMVFGAVLVAELDFHPIDPFAEPPQCPLDNDLDLSSKFLAALDVVVGIHLD
jgi:hypothetical protein